jgi:hypothetical protein
LTGFFATTVANARHTTKAPSFNPVGQEAYSSKTVYVFQWRLAITVAGNSASICTIPPGYNRNLTKIEVGLRVVDNRDGGKLEYFYK